jgi:twitching motility two-component system response regulator PilG
LIAGNVITIGTLGLTQTEENILKSICILAKGRTLGSYTVVDVSKLSESDVVIVNADDLNASNTWTTLATTGKPPMKVLYTRVPSAQSDSHYILCQFSPSKILALLDSIDDELRDSAVVWKIPSLAQQNTSTPISDSRRALVIDDSPTVCKQLEIELSNLNFITDIAGTGEQGLELLSLNAYDIIFLDLLLPRIDGYQVCKEIRRNLTTKHTPVIMLTSKSSAFDRVRGSLVGCNAYLTKPVDYAAFRKEISKHINIDASNENTQVPW